MSRYPVTSIEIDKNRLLFQSNREDAVENPVWDALWNRQSPGRIAVACATNSERVEKLKQEYTIELNEKPFRSGNCTAGAAAGTDY